MYWKRRGIGTPTSKRFEVFGGTVGKNKGWSQDGRKWEMEGESHFKIGVWDSSLTKTTQL